jgi:hypothetical protein
LEAPVLGGDAEAELGRALQGAAGGELGVARPFGQLPAVDGAQQVELGPLLSGRLPGGTQQVVDPASGQPATLLVTSTWAPRATPSSASVT